MSEFIFTGDRSMSLCLKKTKWVLFLGTIHLSLPCFAFLDFIGNQAKQTIEVAAYTDAAVDLALELTPDDDIKEGAQDIKKRSEIIRRRSSEVVSLGTSVKGIMEGPDWTSKRLDTNIRATSNYVKRFKRILLRAAALGSQGTTALNTAETNAALNEVQKNQQAMILQNEDTKLRDLERDYEDAKQWDQFSKNQRRLRSREAYGGKL